MKGTRDENFCAAAMGLVKQTYMWLKRLSITPKIMCTIPITTDIFILQEFRKVSLFDAIFQIFGKRNTERQENKISRCFLNKTCGSCYSDANNLLLLVLVRRQQATEIQMFFIIHFTLPSVMYYICTVFTSKKYNVSSSLSRGNNRDIK